MTAVLERDCVLQEYLRPLRPFLDDPQITELCINRPGSVMTESYAGWQSHTFDKWDEAYSRRLCRTIATFNDRTVNQHKTLLSGALPGGERAFCVLPPNAETTSITIRKPSRKQLSNSDLIERGLYDSIGQTGKTADDADLRALHQRADWPAFLAAAVKARKNIIIAGATGSGKTTLAKVLIQSIDPDTRIVTIEDVRELVVPQPNRVHLLYESDGASGTVTAKELLRGALRMRPDRILLSELRGAEAYDYLVNVNSGHPGSITTIHAGSAAEAREMLMLRISESPEGRNLSTQTIETMLRKTVDIIVQMRIVDGQRRITEIDYEI